MSLTALKPSQELVDLVGTLRGEWHGYVAMCRCPAHTDHDPSLSLRQGDRDILVHCFAGCDPILILRELRRVRPDRRYDVPSGKGRRTSPANIERLWAEAGPVQGTPAERYLAMRRLPADLPDIRFHPRCPHGPKPLTRFKPALLVGVREGPRLTAFQRIFLDRATGWYQVKVMLGTPGGGAWRGGRAGTRLAIAEGFEDAAAFAALNDLPCWASLGAGRLHQLTIPDQVGELLIAEDNDRASRNAAARAGECYSRPGLSISRAPPPRSVKDWAEALEIAA